MNILHKKLKVIGGITISFTYPLYSNYRAQILPIKVKILSGEIPLISVDYHEDTFHEEHYPVIEEKGWRHRVVEFSLEITGDLECSLTLEINNWSSLPKRVTMEFNLPEEMLPLFKNNIEWQFQNKCVDMREEEEKKAQQKREREIGQELLRKVK